MADISVENLKINYPTFDSYKFHCKKIIIESKKQIKILKKELHQDKIILTNSNLNNEDFTELINHTLYIYAYIQILKKARNLYIYLHNKDLKNIKKESVEMNNSHMQLMEVIEKTKTEQEYIDCCNMSKECFDKSKIHIEYVKSFL